MGGIRLDRGPQSAPGAGHRPDRHDTGWRDFARTSPRAGQPGAARQCPQTVRIVSLLATCRRAWLGNWAGPKRAPGQGAAIAPAGHRSSGTIFESTWNLTGQGAAIAPAGHRSSGTIFESTWNLRYLLQVISWSMAILKINPSLPAPFMYMRLGNHKSPATRVCSKTSLAPGFRRTRNSPNAIVSVVSASKRTHW